MFGSDEVDDLDTVSWTVLVDWAMGPKVVDYSQEQNWAQFSIRINFLQGSLLLVSTPND